MSDGYKNILANGYMRDTNYIIIKDCDNIDELNIQWNKFLSNMTIRQQRLSDDKSIEIWNITNQQHYEIQKQQFLKKLKKKDIEGNKEIIPSNIVDLNDDTLSSIFSSGDFDEFKKDIDLNDPKYYTEDNNINLTLPDDIKDDPNDNAMKFNQDSTMSIVGNIAGNNAEDKLKNLEKEFIKFNSQSNDIKRKADDKCRELYGGSSNLDRYNKLKSEYLSNKTKEDPEPKDFIPSIEPQDNSDNDEIKCNEKICRYHYNDNSAVTEALHNDSFIARCYSAYILNSINEASDHKEMKRLEDVPYFTPQELIDLGVHGNNNYYSKMSDNDGLTKDISISTWFDSYKDLSMNHIFEDYRKEWINKLNELYSDYYDIKDEDKLLARKQSILDLGWNPEIPFTNENRIKASDRVNEIFKQTIPNDIFIDMSNVPESDDYLSESIDTSYEPVFLVLTKGKTPVISQGIKFVTNSEYSHASITFDPELEEVYSFNMRKESFGFVRENKSSFKENFISVFAFFAPKNIVNKLKETVYDFGNHKTTFDLKIFANKIFHINHKASNNEYNQVCSTFVDTVLQSGGINLVGDQKIPAPSDIYNGAKSEPNKIFEVYNGIAPKYDGKKVKRQINYLRTNQDTLSINEGIIKDIKKCKESIKDYRKLKKDYKILTKDLFPDKDNEDESNDSIMNEDVVYSKLKNNGNGQKDPYNKEVREIYSTFSKEERKVTGFTNYRDVHEYLYYRKIYYIDKDVAGFADLYLCNKKGQASNKDDYSTVKISYGLKPKYRKRGLGDKIISDTMLFCKNDKYIETLVWPVELGNDPSNYLAQKYGLKNTMTTKEFNSYEINFNKSTNESFSFVNEDYTFVKYKNKDNLYSKGKELYDSLPKQDKEFLGGHYIDSKNIYYRKIYTSGKDITGFGELYIFDSSPNDAILMYAVSPDYRNKGLSNKILNDIFDFCKKDKNIHSIIWRANKNNDASNYLANKYKMKLIHSDDRDNEYSMVFNESFSYINEVKKFPIEFDDNGNLTIYKCRMGNISYGDEIDDSSELLESYRNTNNIEGMKYEVSRLWFIISDIEKKMTKRIDSKKYDEYVRNRATATNIFKHNLEYLMKMDKDFNFAEYYNTTPFSNNSVKITNNTLKYSMKTLQQFIMK